MLVPRQPARRRVVQFHEVSLPGRRRTTETQRTQGLWVFGSLGCWVFGLLGLCGLSSKGVVSTLDKCICRIWISGNRFHHAQRGIEQATAIQNKGTSIAHLAAAVTGLPQVRVGDPGEEASRPVRVRAGVRTIELL